MTLACQADFDVPIDSGIARTPLSYVQATAAYPDAAQPMQANGGVSLVARDPVQWRRDNQQATFERAWETLSSDIGTWPKDRVQVSVSYVFDSLDPRLSLSGDNTTLVVATSTTHALFIVPPAPVAMVYVRPKLPSLPKNVTLGIEISVDTHKDSLELTPGCSRQRFSDQLVHADALQYLTTVTVTGPDFTDPALSWHSESPITVGLPPGLRKIVTLPVALPVPPPSLSARLARYLPSGPSL